MLRALPVAASIVAYAVRASDCLHGERLVAQITVLQSSREDAKEHLHSPYSGTNFVQSFMSNCKGTECRSIWKMMPCIYAEIFQAYHGT